MVYLAISLFYMEMIVRIFCSKRILDESILYIAIFSILVGCIARCIASFGKAKVNRKVAGVILGVMTFVYVVQTVYKLFFGKYLVLYSIFVGGVEQVASKELIATSLQALKNGLLPAVLLILPFLAFVIFSKKYMKMKRLTWKKRLLLLLGAVGVFVCSFVSVQMVPDKKEIHNGVFDADIMIENFGLLHTGVLDFKCNVLGIEPDIELQSVGEVELEDAFGEEELKAEYEPNVMNIDFEKLLLTEEDETIRMLHQYFNNEEPTYKNEYTGMFEGYNLITITAEGFSPYVIDEELTPTLYKMQNEGFQFKNFYTPIWGVSTSDGEYVSCTGLLPQSGVWSFFRSGENSMPFCLGNQFEKIGVDLRFAYHNHTYDYYHRDISHPNMGYTYKGLGNGFTTEQIKKVWPESDLEMIEASIADYVQSEKPFLAYYMTVSGHLEYNRYGNSMANKNWSYVENMEASDTVKAYIACNIELDRALGRLLEALENAGVADKTVIALVADHYPYGLETDKEEDNYMYFNEILGHPIEENFELYKSTCLLYCASMEEPVVVEKYGANVDLLPTLSNLFGLEYDSRLLIGRDLLSEEEQLVVFSNRSWISERGIYHAIDEKFQAFAGMEFENQEEEDVYLERMKKQVEEKFQISTLVLNTDYYASVLP